MFDPERPKIQDKGRNNSVHFEKAYWQVMEQVEAPLEAINALLPRLYDSFEAGSPVKQMRYLGQYLPEGRWRWPEYERQMLANSEEQLEDDEVEPDAPSNREMLEILINRIYGFAYGFAQHQRILDASKRFPYLLLNVVDASKAKPECIENDYKPYRIDSEFWKRDFPPCERIDCMCNVTQMNELMLKQRGLKIVDKA